MAEKEPEGDEVAMHYLAQKLYLESLKRTPNQVVVGVRWGCMRPRLRAIWLRRARETVQEWVADEKRATASREAMRAKFAPKALA